MLLVVNKCNIVFVEPRKQQQQQLQRDRADSRKRSHSSQHPPTKQLRLSVDIFVERMSERSVEQHLVSDSERAWLRERFSGRRNNQEASVAQPSNPVDEHDVGTGRWQRQRRRKRGQRQSGRRRHFVASQLATEKLSRSRRR